jgi:hypothetical protein
LVDKAGVENESVELECEISKPRWKKTGHEVVVKWFKGERELRDTIKYSIKRNEKVHTLVIRELSIDDIAEYSAVVLEEKTKAQLTIDG